MDLAARLRLMPPGTLVPADWVLAELERAGGTTGPSPTVETAADLTVDQVAEKLGRAPSTVRNWLGEERLPGAYRLRGREWRIPAATLQAFLQAEATGERASPQARSPGAQLSDWRKVRKAG